MIKTKHQIATEAVAAALDELARLDRVYAAKEADAQRVKDEAELLAKKTVEDAQKEANRIAEQTKALRNMLQGLSS